MTNKKYNGIIIPAVTPLTQTYQLDVAAVDRMMAYFRENNASPFILGTTGEAPSLSFKLREEYIKAASGFKQDGEMLYAGIAGNCFEETLDIAVVAAEYNVDAVVATLPSYYQLTEPQMKRYFERLADACTVPLIVYNIPATVHQTLPVHLIEELSYHPNVVAVKDSERNDRRLFESLRLWSDRPDFSYFLGWAAKSAVALINGADGIVPSTGNINAEIYHEMWQAVEQGDHARANALQNVSDELGNLYQQGRTLGESLWALKTLMQEKGLCEPYVMPPLEPMSDDEKVSILDSLNEFIKVGTK
ncbi:dihydrodipicolinate synthase family protein [Mucilaginibacter sp. RS28]|uniref:Dihydrodipicolinate synthase family protein n=1 Tax=Mucilaginibacter straminoryzae TaxID=2932774 RepID=A0A9X2BBN4_9SPHI|nr:dihydrodipicolinate synthase family protein [Mucilaginibacter straminoryzae]MCJ8210032.1 dihydrodipicolinate synthase family protein [Mucilaginibacter straminoryzae]